MANPGPTITRPYSKLNRLCAEAAARGSGLTSFAAVAKAIGLTPGRITQMFGYGREAEGTLIRPETAGLIAGAFTRDGVPCEIDWLLLEYDDFAARLAGAGVTAPKISEEAISVEWQLQEASALSDLVELRLHPPRPGNEVEQSYYVDATLLFGNAICDFDSETEEEPRTISIGLRDARLSIGSDSYRPLQGSMLGERVDSGNFTRVAGGIVITGPTRNGILQGDPIGDQHLAVIAATNVDDGPFAVTVAVHRRSFVVVDVDAPNGTSIREDDNYKVDNKNVILNHFIYQRCARDEAGRAVVAQATMLRRSKS